MNEKLRQPPMLTWPRQSRGFKWWQVLMVLLPIAAAAGLILLARTAAPNQPAAGTQDGWARAASNYVSSDQAAVPSKSLEEILAHPDIIPTHHHPLLGRLAPDFELSDPDGKFWNLNDSDTSLTRQRRAIDGRPVVLIFYYGFHCVSCVRQLYDLNRDLPLFQGLGARVVAISADPPELTRRRFEQHGALAFPVLSDPGNEVAQAYGVFRPAQDGATADFLRHATFVIDPYRTVQWANVGDAPFRRNSALLYQLAEAGGRLSLPGGNIP